MAICYAKEAAFVCVNSYSSITWYQMAGVHCNDNFLLRNFARYDLSKIPYKSKIISAQLKMYCYAHVNNGTDCMCNIARITDAWDETAVTWNNKPGYEGGYLPEDVVHPALATWTDWDVTTLVQGWVNEDFPNYGLSVVDVVGGYGGGITEWWFYGGEYEGGLYAPYIEIEYEPEEEYRITKIRMNEIANQVRRITGVTDTMSPERIVTALQSVSAQTTE